MTAARSMLHVRMDEETKVKATAVLAVMSLSASDAVRLLFHRIIVDQAFPLELKVPNAATRAAMADADHIMAERHARFADGATLITDMDG